MNTSSKTKYEAGLMLEGWEVKAIRAGRAQLKEAYVTVKGDELFLFGSHISPLLSASTHIHPDPITYAKTVIKQKRNRQNPHQSATRWLHHHATGYAFQSGTGQTRSGLG